MRLRLSIRITSLMQLGVGGLVFIVALSGLSGRGLCNGDNTDLIGCWQGNAPDDSMVTLEVTADAADIDYGRPRECEAAGEFSRTEADKTTYYIGAPYGGSLQGWCLKIRNAKMTLLRNSDGSLMMVIAQPKKKINERVMLQKKSCD